MQLVTIEAYVAKLVMLLNLKYENQIPNPRVETRLNHKLYLLKPGMIMNAYYFSIWEADVEGSRIQGHPWLHGEFSAILSPKSNWTKTVTETNSLFQSKEGCIKKMSTGMKRKHILVWETIVITLKIILCN